MRIRLALATALLPMWVLVGNAALPDGAPQHLTYEQFAALTPEDRHERFRSLEDGNKAVLLREHVDRWLAQNRWRLSSAQIAIVEELGSLLFDRFHNPAASGSPEYNERVDALGLQGLYGGKAECSLRHSDFWTVLGPMAQPLPPDWGWRDDMWKWFERCIAPKVLR